MEHSQWVKIIIFMWIKSKFYHHLCPLCMGKNSLLIHSKFPGTSDRQEEHKKQRNKSQRNRLAGVDKCDTSTIMVGRLLVLIKSELRLEAIQERLGENITLGKLMAL